MWWCCRQTRSHGSSHFKRFVKYYAPILSPEIEGQFRCPVETQDELPDCEKWKAKILEESEARKQAVKELVSGAMIVSKNNTQRFGNNKNNQYNINNGNSEKKKFPFRCSKCPKLGHRATDCRSKGQVLMIKIHIMHFPIKRKLWWRLKQ